LDVSDPEWGVALGKIEHDVYHLPEYGALDASEGGGTPIAAHFEDGDGGVLLLPIVLREIEGFQPLAGYFDAVSPYGYAGPVASGLRGAALRRALESTWAELRRRHVVSAYLRLHPILSGGGGIWDVGAGAVKQEGVTVRIDLRESRDSLTGAFRTGHRYEIGRLEKRGFTCRQGLFESYDEFVALYRGTMARVGADARYRFSDAYFHALRETLGERLVLVSCHAPDGTMAAGSLFLASRRGVQYHLSGSHADFRKLAPSKGVLQAAILWAKDTGYEWFHLGGGFGAGQASLFRFKAGFSDDHIPYSSLRVFPDPARYARLTGIDHIEEHLLDSSFPPHRHA
jgi:hypothetical protein